MATKPHLRVLTFAAVLIIVGGLVVGLFQEASAVSITTGDPSDSNIRTGDGTFTVDVTVQVPQNQRLPVDAVRAIIERTSTSTKASPSTVANVQCATPIPAGCSSTGNGTVPSITFEGTSPSGLSGYGYDACSGYCYVTHPGYGYDASGGYGYDLGIGGNGYEINDVGYGYGYSSGTLELTWRVTIDPGELPVAGHYWLTFNVETGSSVLGDVQGEAKYFPVTATPASGGGGGGGGGTGGGDGGGSGGSGSDTSVTVSAGDSVTVTKDTDVQVNVNVDGINTVVTTFAQDCTDCTIDVQVHTERPGDAPADDAGTRVMRYLSITVKDANGNPVSGATGTATLTFEVDASDLGQGESPNQVVLLHGQDSTWVYVDTTLTSDEDADPLTYEASFDGFSPFAVVLDQTAPTMSDESPTGDIQVVSPEISASWSDNRGIDASTLDLTLDGAPVGDDTGTLTTTSTGFSYVHGTPLSEGAHTVVATVEDRSGLTVSKTWTFTVTAPECAAPPTIAAVNPTDGATGVPADQTITITLTQGDCPVDPATIVLTLNGQNVPATYDAGTITAAIPAELAGEALDAQVSLEDTGGNKVTKAWGFGTTQADDGEEPPVDGGEPGDDDSSGLVWIVLLLIVAAIAAAAYLYYGKQQE